MSATVIEAGSTRQRGALTGVVSAPGPHQRPAGEETEKQPDGVSEFHECPLAKWFK
jgi:hypothetical protein